MEPLQSKLPIADRSRPALLESYFDTKQLSGFAPERLRQAHGQIDVRAMTNIQDAFLSSFRKEDWKDMSFDQFVQLMKESETPIYNNQHPLSDFTSVSGLLDFAGFVEGAKPEYIWVGTRGSNIGLHFDLGYTLLAQVYGRKRYVLFDGEHSGDLYPFRDDITRSQVDLANVDDTRFPKILQTPRYEGVLSPGDVLYIPTAWWHFFCAESDSVSVSTFIDDPAAKAKIWRNAKHYGWSYGAGVARDFVWHGVLNRPFVEKGYGWPPTGKIIFDILKDSAKRALRISQ